MVLFAEGLYSRMAIVIADTTQSISISTGALSIAGGVGVTKNLNIGGLVTITDTTQSTLPNNGALTVAGGLGVERNVYIGGQITAFGLFCRADTKLAGYLYMSVQNTTIPGADPTVATSTYPVYIYDNPILLRGTPDARDNNHYIMYTSIFESNLISIDGPALVGFSGGVLGTNSGGDKCILRWDTTGVYLPSPGGTPSPLNHYENNSYNTTFTYGNKTSISITIFIYRIGGVIHIYIPYIDHGTNTNGSNVGSFSNTAMPSRFRPASDVIFPINVQNVATYNFKIAFIKTNGIIEILDVNQGGFGNNTRLQSYGSCFTYSRGIFD
jgi:hypothetical protein